MLFKALALLFFVSAALADLPEGTVDCGGDTYSPSDVENAVNYGYQLLEEGQTLGSGTLNELGHKFFFKSNNCFTDSYPHQFYKFVYCIYSDGLY